MSDIFLKIVNMSISAAWTVFAVLIVRLLIKKAPKWINVLLWGIVALRLLMFASPKSIFSLIPSAETVSIPQTGGVSVTVSTGIPVVDTVLDPLVSSSLAAPPEYSADPIQILIPILAAVWIAGIAGMLLYTAISYLRLRRAVSTAVPKEDGIYECESIPSPFILGIIKPKIYLPVGLGEKDTRHVIAHEIAHIKRKDHLWKPLGFLFLAIHWFNPLMWAAYILLCKDIELACDEKAVSDLTTDARADYSEALISCSVSRRSVAACPVAFGEVGIKKRVKSVLSYKRPALWIIVAALAAVAVLALCFLTDPVAKVGNIKDQKPSSELEGLSLEIVSANTETVDPYLTVRCENKTGSDLICSSDHSLFMENDGAWVDCCTNGNTANENDNEGEILSDPENYDFDVGESDGAFEIRINGNDAPSEPVILQNGETAEIEIDLTGMTMTKPGKYRLETSFSVGTHSAQSYKGHIEFKLTKAIAPVTPKTFSVSKVVYSSPVLSFQETPNTAPTFRLVNGNTLQVLDHDNSIIGSGKIERIGLSPENFDSRFRFSEDEDAWNSTTLAKLKKSNRRAWNIQSSDASYMLLLQRDGTFYLAECYSSQADPNMTFIKWIYELNEAAPTSQSSTSAWEIDDSNATN